MSRTVVIKLGSSVIAEDDGTLRGEVLDRVVKQVARRRALGDRVVVVSSGAIACGLPLLGLSARPVRIEELQATSAVGQGRLFRAWEERFTAAGLLPAQVLLTAADVAAREHYLNARRTLVRLLDWDVVPVVNENDVTASEEISFGDNDFLAAQIATLVGASDLILLTSTEGLFTANPAVDPDAELVTVVDSPADLDDLSIDDHRSAHGSGGMQSKVVSADIATAAGVAVTICSGISEDAIGLALDGEAVGTRFPAGTGQYSSFKLWLRYAKPSRGSVEVDAGAANALRTKGVSLLPVGVAHVNGDFRAGDAIDVVHDGYVLGKGLSQYDSTSLRTAAGRRSAELAELVPPPPDEVVHRDYFVLTD
ncbi:MAG: glutamate 5-kinase [Solirubrobacteraceae bacterium]